MKYVIVASALFSMTNLALTATTIFKTKKVVEDAQEMVLEERAKLNANKDKVAKLIADLDL